MTLKKVRSAPELLKLPTKDTVVTLELYEHEHD